MKRERNTGNAQCRSGKKKRNSATRESTPNGKCSTYGCVHRRVECFGAQRECWPIEVIEGFKHGAFQVRVRVHEHPLTFCEVEGDNASRIRVRPRRKRLRTVSTGARVSSAISVTLISRT